MRTWIAKAIIQKLISFLPFGHRINYFFQKYITRGVRLTDELFEDKLLHIKQHLYAFQKHSRNPWDYSVLELGTGWFPVIPVCLYMTGAREIITVDINPLMKKQNVKKTFKKIIEYYNNNKLHDFLGDIRQDRVEIIKKSLYSFNNVQINELLQELNIRYVVNDIRKISIRDNSIDLIISNNTFEHIKAEHLKDMLLSFKKFIVPGGVMSHFIDMTDHFAHIDKTITVYNFLKFSDKQWSLIDNRIQPQNRLRLPDYRLLYKNAGIDITEEINRDHDINIIKTIKLDSKFKTSPMEDIAVTHSQIISLI